MVRKEAAWVLANLACGPQEHVDLIVSSGAIDALVYTLREGGLDLKKEAGYALCNIVKDGRALGTVCVLHAFMQLRLYLGFVVAPGCRCWCASRVSGSHTKRGQQ